MPILRRGICALLLLILVFPSITAATTIVAIITPSGITFGSDSGFGKYAGDNSEISTGRTEKLEVVQDHILVASTGMNSIFFGKKMTYSFSSWIKDIESRLPVHTSVKDLAIDIEKQSAATFAGFDRVFAEGMLKQYKPLEDYTTFIEYIVAGYDTKRPQVYVVRFYIDWSNKKLVGPIRTMLYPNANDTGVYVSYFFGVTQALDDAKDRRSYASKYLSIHCPEFAKMMAGQVVTLDESDKIARAFVKVEEEIDPIEVFGEIRTIHLLPDGSVVKAPPQAFPPHTP